MRGGLVLVGLAVLGACDPSAEERAARLERELQGLLRAGQALVRTDGCPTSEECAAAAVGQKPCGGPREHWVYCRRTTDEAALLRALDEARRVDERLNALRGASSDCVVVEPPALESVEGVCRAR